MRTGFIGQSRPRRLDEKDSIITSRKKATGFSAVVKLLVLGMVLPWVLPIDRHGQSTRPHFPGGPGR